MMPRVFALLLLLLMAAPAQAHKASTSYLHLRVDDQQLEGRWDIALRDLDYAIGLDANDDGRITWGEVRGAQSRIADYALQHLKVDGDGKTCTLAVDGLQIVEHSDGNYAVLDLRGTCSQAPLKLQLDYSLLFELDALHRGLLDLEFPGDGAKNSSHLSALFAPDAHVLNFEPGSTQVLRVFREYFRAGLIHVWSGLDHLLFLAGLFLPAVLRRSHGEWLPTPSLRKAVRDTALIVTAFTLAHACTLTLAATGAFTLPSRWVECAVAATVCFAGLNNLVPMVYRELFWLSAGFGLIHGAAVASALIDLGLPAGGRVWALLAFNLGVEAAQLSLLALVIPPTYYFRYSRWYRWIILLPGSAAVTLVGAIWFLERAFDLQLGVRLP